MHLNSHQAMTQSGISVLSNTHQFPLWLHHCQSLCFHKSSPPQPDNTPLQSKISINQHKSASIIINQHNSESFSSDQCHKIHQNQSALININLHSILNGLNMFLSAKTLTLNRGLVYNLNSIGPLPRCFSLAACVTECNTTPNAQAGDGQSKKNKK